jgi:hypothetical protein
MRYYKELSDKLGRALEAKANAIDHNLIVSKESVKACWLQEKPPDLDGQAKRVLKNPVGSLSASGFAYEKVAVRSEADAVAMQKSSKKRKEAQEWGLCGVKCQCQDPATCPVKDKAQCGGCGKVQSRASVNPVCGRCKKRPEYASKMPAICDAV